MGVRFPGQGTTVIANVTLTTTTETAVCVSAPINISLDFQQVLIFFYWVLTTGTTVTSITQRVYRGSTISGTLLNVATAVTAAASIGCSGSGLYIDTPGAVAGVQYTLSLKQNGAGSNGTMNDVAMAVIGL